MGGGGVWKSSNSFYTATNCILVSKQFPLENFDYIICERSLISIEQAKALVWWYNGQLWVFQVCLDLENGQLKGTYTYTSWDYVTFSKDVHMYVLVRIGLKVQYVLRYYAGALIGLLRKVQSFRLIHWSV